MIWDLKFPKFIGITQAKKFYDQEKFNQLIKNQNFTNISYRNLSGGITAIHSAWKV